MNLILRTFSQIKRQKPPMAMRDEDIADNWYRIRLLVTCFGAWVRDYRHEQLVDDSLNLKVVPYYQARSQQRYLNRWKIRTKNSIKEKCQRRFYEGLSNIFVNLIAYKRGVDSWCTFVMRNLKYRSHIRKRIYNVPSARVMNMSRFFKRLHSRRSRRTRLNWIVASVNVAASRDRKEDVIAERMDREEEMYLASKQEMIKMNSRCNLLMDAFRILRNNFIIAGDLRAQILHSHEFSKRKRKFRAMLKLKLNVMASVKTQKWRAYWKRISRFTCIQRALSILSRRVSIRQGNALRVCSLDTYSLKQVLHTTLCKLKFNKDSRSVMRQNEEYIISLNANKQCQLALVSWLRFLKRRLRQNPLNVKGEKHKLTRWRFNRLGDCVDVWKWSKLRWHRQKLSVNRGIQHRSHILLRDYLSSWLIYMNYRRRHSRGRIISTFFDETFTSKKYFRAWRLFIHSRKKSRPGLIKSILFWKLWRGTLVLRRWSFFVLLRRFRRERAIRQMTDEQRKALNPHKCMIGDSLDPSVNEVEKIVEDGRNLFKGIVLAGPISNLTKRVYSPLPMLHDTSSSNLSGSQDSAGVLKSDSKFPKSTLLTSTTSTSATTVTIENDFSPSGARHINNLPPNLVRAKPRTLIPDFVTMPQPLRYSTFSTTKGVEGASPLLDYHSALAHDSSKFSTHFHPPKAPQLAVCDFQKDNKCHIKSPPYDESPSGCDKNIVGSKNINTNKIALAREIIEFVAEFRRNVHTL